MILKLYFRAQKINHKMRRLLLAVVLFLYAYSNAQSTRFGVKAGANISWLNGDADLPKPVPGFHAGGFVEIKISDKFSIQPEILFSTQGGKVQVFENYGYSYYSEKQTISLGYLNIPILAKYYITKGFSIEAGPQTGINLYARKKFDYYSDRGVITQVSGNLDVKETVKALDFGLALGVSYYLNEKLFLQARYVVGLTSVHKEIDDDFGKYNPDIRNGVGQISLGYRF